MAHGRRHSDIPVSAEVRVAYLEERLARQTVVIADLVEACGQLIKHCDPDKPTGGELLDARLNAMVIIKRHGIRYA